MKKPSLLWRLSNLALVAFGYADLADPTLRSRDNLFWQVELVFLPKDAPAFATNTHV